jgi:hypothetical protein
MISVKMKGNVLIDAIKESRNGEEERGYLQVCNRMSVNPTTNMLESINNEAVDRNHYYSVTLPRNLLKGFCNIQTLIEFGRTVSVDDDTYVPALNLVIAYYAKDMWRRLGNTFDEIDINNDGYIDSNELSLAFYNVYGKKVFFFFSHHLYHYIEQWNADSIHLFF